MCQNGKQAARDLHNSRGDWNDSIDRLAGVWIDQWAMGVRWVMVRVRVMVDGIYDVDSG